MTTCFSLFSGGGLADIGLHAAGYQSIGAGGFGNTIVTAPDIEPAFTVTANTNQAAQLRTIALDQADVRSLTPRALAQRIGECGIDAANCHTVKHTVKNRTD